jgi:hypothetical protein
VTVAFAQINDENFHSAEWSRFGEDPASRKTTSALTDDVVVWLFSDY